MKELTEKQKIRRKFIAMGMCAECTCREIHYEKSKQRCVVCLDRDKTRRKLNTDNEFGVWRNRLGAATNNVLKGKNQTKAKILSWTHEDAVAKFGERIKTYGDDGLAIDHKIPIECARTFENKVDLEFASLVTSLNNMQLTDRAENSKKYGYVEKDIRKRTEELRKQGMSGKLLFDTLNAEFKDKLTCVKVY